MTFNISNILGLERCHVHHDARFDHFIRLRGAQRAEPGKGKGRENEPALSQHDVCSRCDRTMDADRCSSRWRARLFVRHCRHGRAQERRCRRSARCGRSYTTPAVGRKAGIATGRRRKRKRRRASGIPVAAGVNDKDFNAGL